MVIKISPGVLPPVGSPSPSNTGAEEIINPLAPRIIVFWLNSKSL